MSSSPLALIFILIFLLLLLFPQYAVEGASDGLLLWFHTVVPALAPAMVCTRMILASGGVPLLMRPLRPLFSRLFSLDEEGAFILLCGMLCGYPMGPALCSRLLSEGKITERDAAYLLAICSYPSPMFLLGYVRQQMSSPQPVLLLIFGIYAPVLVLAAAARSMYARKETESGISVSSRDLFSESPEKLDSILYSVCDTMVLIGGYLMLFSILICFIRHAAWIPAIPGSLLCAVFEMTTGIRQICRVLPPVFQLPACAAAAAFGGLSGIFQTKSVMTVEDSSHSFLDTALEQNRKNAGFDIRHYLGWKLLHAGLSALILTVLQLVLPPGFPPQL